MNYTTSNYFKKGYWVYIHTCPNGKKYVGCTAQTTPEKRWKEGRAYSNTCFLEDILKYGWDNIKHEVWELTSESEMYYAEKYLIAYYQTTVPEFGYNISTGGRGTWGVKKTEETREKLSKILKQPRYLLTLPGGRKKVCTLTVAKLAVSKFPKASFRRYLEPQR